jgi:hypothetical protein
LARIARPGVAIIRDVLVGPILGFDEGRERRKYSPPEHGAIGKYAHGPQYCQTQHSYHDDETIPPARAREIIVTIIGAVSFASFGRLDIAIVAVVGRSEQQRRCLGARQKPAADRLCRANPAEHRGWLGARKGKILVPLLTLPGRGVFRGPIQRGRCAVAPVIGVGITLASEPIQLGQQIAYSPARGLLASLPGDGIAVSTAEDAPSRPPSA